MSYLIRHSTADDLPTILKLRDQAREIMRSYGNTFQWPVGYPRDDMFKKDIEEGFSYVMTDADGSIAGTFALIPGPDITYHVIYEGQWLDDEPYHVIHRIASTPESHGILDALLDFCETKAPNIRIDTHQANVIMRKGLEKHRYQYCGIIHLLNGDERMAFQKNVPKMNGRLYTEILSRQDPVQAVNLSRFFKTGKGQYGEGDKFLGVKVPITREIVKQCWQQTTFDDLESCIRSEYHEIRLAALLTLVQIFKHAKKNVAEQKHCIDFYLTHTEFINNWDLVDLSCYELLGTWLLDKDRTLLYDLARNGKTIWEQRIGMVSTMQFIRHGQLDDTYAIAELFLAKPRPLHDLLQKAVGWLLREAGKHDEQRLKDWLSERCQTMPRTMLRYAIEKFTEEERKSYILS